MDSTKRTLRREDILDAGGPKLHGFKKLKISRIPIVGPLQQGRPRNTQGTTIKITDQVIVPFGLLSVSISVILDKKTSNADIT